MYEHKPIILVTFVKETEHFCGKNGALRWHFSREIKAQCTKTCTYLSSTFFRGLNADILYTMLLSW